MICTAPFLKINIEEYPAIKNWLTNGEWTLKKTKNNPPTNIGTGKERLIQAGLTFNINGVKFKSRKKSNNKWFELQDSINYMEDFYKPKIMYPEIVQHPRFYLDDKGRYFAEASAFIITGENIKILTEILNDDVFGWIFKTFYAGGGLGKGYRYKKSYLLNLPLPQVSKALEYPEVDFNFLKNSYNLTDKEVEYLFKKIY